MQRASHFHVYLVMRNNCILWPEWAQLWVYNNTCNDQKWQTWILLYPSYLVVKLLWFHFPCHEITTFCFLSAWKPYCMLGFPQVQDVDVASEKCKWNSIISENLGSLPDKLHVQVPPAVFRAQQSWTSRIMSFSIWAKFLPLNCKLYAPTARW